MNRDKQVFRSRVLPAGLALSLAAALALAGAADPASAGSSQRPGATSSVELRDAHLEAAKPAAPVAESPKMKAAIEKTAKIADEPVVWPAPGRHVVSLAAAESTTAGAALVRSRSKALGSVELNFLDQTASRRAGVAGVLLTAKATAKADVELSLDYSGFAHAFGADWAGRLTVVSLPACALTTPAVPSCSVASPLPTRNDTAARKLNTSAPVAPTTSVLAVTAGAESSTGDYAATKLSPTASWSGGSASGDFGWSYPLRVPPAAAGPEPKLAFQYSSQSIDGRTSAANNQASWVGDGFDFTDSYVERKYVSCDQDDQAKKFDLCWKYDNATLVLNGVANELVRKTGTDIGTSTWRLKNDDGSRVEKLIGTDTGNEDRFKEYWRVTTTDGTQYYFGVQKVASNSVWTVPVASDDDKEPCHGSTFAASFCTQAWRWNLDYVEDVHGNAMTYRYAKELNNYAKNGVASPGTSYVRGGYLERIDYGLRKDNLTAAAPQQVVFTPAERCLKDCSVLSSTTKANWPDVPFDQICDAGKACTNKVAPTFFTRKRLYQIETKVLKAGSLQSVDFWQTNHTFPDPGDGSGGAPMWLAGISHSGKAGSTITTPSVTFKGDGMANRVDAPADNANGLVRYRISEINTETGAKIMLNYAPKDCMAGERPRVDFNAKRCYPVKWTPPLDAERTDWFHKYVLDSVVTSDSTGNGETMVTNYVYSGGGAWHYQETALLKDKDKTWSDWRGYASVTTYTGDPSMPSQRSKSTSTFFRGMDGDKIEGSAERKNVTVEDSKGGVYEDKSALMAKQLEQITYLSAASSTQVSGTITEYSIQPTATQTVPWGTLTANFVGDAEVKSRTVRDGGRPDLVRTTATEYDPDNGLPAKVSDLGDVSKSGDEACTITSFTKKTTSWLMALPTRVVSSSGVCDAYSANPPEARAVSDVRTFYDKLTFGDASMGEATSEQRLDRYVDGLPVYQTVNTKTYDALGRVTTVTDALGRTATTAYTPAAGGALTQTVMSTPKVTLPGGSTASFATTTSIAPEWGLPSKTVDANGRITEMAYDALGRLTSVWLPTQSRASSEPANVKYAYSLSQTSVSTVRTDKLNVDGTGYLTSYQQFDSLLRPRQTQTPGANSGRNVTESRYDSRGQVIYSNSNIWDSGAPSAALAIIPNASVPTQTYHEYDGAGRVVKETFQPLLQPKWSTTTSYGGDITTVLPPAGGSAKSTVTDVRGQVIENREYSGNTVTGTPQVTKYTFDLTGRMTQMIGAGGTWTYDYDLRGRKIRSTDPDAGTTTTTYDSVDRVVSTTDAEQNTLFTTYDVLDRKTGLYATSVAPANMLSEWLYDQPGYLGQVYMSTSYTAGKTGPAYREVIDDRNELYNPTSVTRDIPLAEGKEIDGSYSTFVKYKPDGISPMQISFAGGGGLGADDVAYEYTPAGLPKRMSSTRGTYVDEAQYSQLAEPAKYELGRAGDMPIDFRYEDDTRRLSRMTHGKVTIFADHWYSYDPAGNLLKDHDVVRGGDAQCFDYDGHQRLAEAWTPADADCAKAPSVAGLGGAAPYWQSWTYSPTGLRKTQVDHKLAGDLTSTYTYNTSQPHTLASVAQTGEGAAPTSNYSYDPRGNTISRPGTQGTQSLSWSAQGKLTKLSGTEGDTTYVYDTNGSLLVRRGPAETTLFLGELELTLNHATRQVLGKRQYNFNGQPIAVRSNTGAAEADFQWLVSDYHQTSHVAVDTETQAATIRYATPFGGPRGSESVGWPDNHGFLGKPDDKNTGLTTVGAREYDSAIGRFISVDPLMDVTNPQQLLGYSYASDNPVTGSDPSGLMEEPVSDSGGSSGEVWTAPDTVKPTDREGRVGLNNSHDDAVRHYTEPIRRKVGHVVYMATSRYADSLAWEAATEIWQKKNKFGRPVPMPSTECINAEDTCIGDGWLKVGYFMDVVCQQSGIQCASHDSPMQEALRSAAENGLLFGGGQGPVAGRLGTGKGVSAKGGGETGFCSFAGTTNVLMADGSYKPIQDIKPGDKVLATDPETGEQAAKTVLRLWAHEDTLTDLVVAGGKVSTTEDHPFWSVTDQRFERAEELTLGEEVLSADGRKVRVLGLAAETAHEALAYNLSVAGIHTYHVVAGAAAVLVHNQGCPKGRLSDPLPQGMSRHFVKAYDDIRAGNGVPRIDPNTGLQKIFRGSGPHERPWADSLEFEVPGTKGDSARILVKTLPDGRLKMGWTTDHYATIKPFTAPHFPDDGWK
ncbi:polymorphic toxin-type HINT domain-containing protein [Kribbella sp. NPDC020789]